MTVFRANIHKNEMYKEQAEVEAWVAEATQIVRDAERGARLAAECDGMSIAAARSILQAYTEATRDRA